MGRGRGAAKAGKTKKRGQLVCPLDGGACYLDSDSESACSDSECSDCYECGPRRGRAKSGKPKAGAKSAKPKPAAKSKPAKPKAKKRSSKRRARDSSSSCSCSDCADDDDSSDDSYNCAPARRGAGRKCSTC